MAIFERVDLKMMINNRFSCIVFACIFFMQGICLGQDLISLKVPYNALGKIRTLDASEISTSPWSVGGETLDRGFAEYDAYKSYLGPLGVKKIRLQGGWAKTEQERGFYNWEWLDQIVENVASQDVTPWLQLSYGNPVYPEGGGTGLGGGLPRSEEALQAWDRWVRNMVQRYGEHTSIWEVWNEPDPHIPAEDYADFYIRTAEIVRKQQPEATLYALSLAQLSKPEYTDRFLSYLQQRDKIHLLDQITYHGYTKRPEDAYPHVENLRAVVRKYSDRIRLHQGEQGAPSTEIPRFALRNHPWTDTSQAKWVLRRMLGDLGHDVPSLVFTIADLHYVLGEDTVANTKGLLKTNPRHEVLYAKPSYYAVQHLASVVNGEVERIKDFSVESNSNKEVNGYAFQTDGGNQTVVVLWDSGRVPGDRLETIKADISLSGMTMERPVYLDLLSGTVYQIPDKDILPEGRRIRIRNFPLSDAPVVITNRTSLSFR